MTEKQRQKDDLAIRRVRVARHEISAEHDHDPKRAVDYYVERQKNQATEEADSADETKPFLSDFVRDCALLNSVVHGLDSLNDTELGTQIDLPTG